MQQFAWHFDQTLLLTQEVYTDKKKHTSWYWAFSLHKIYITEGKMNGAMHPEILKMNLLPPTRMIRMRHTVDGPSSIGQQTKTNFKQDSELVPQG